MTQLIEFEGYIDSTYRVWRIYC